MFSGKYDHEKRSGAHAGFVDGCEVAQREYEVKALAEIVHALYPLRLLEIGTYQGGTLAYWCRAAAEGAQIIGVDNRAADGLWARWMGPNELRYHHLQMDSHEQQTRRIVEELLDGEPLDFLFIDGDHTVEGVTKDFMLYGPLVRKGGVIAFHDILNPSPERNQDHIRVSLLWKRIRNAGYMTRELIAHPDQTWGGIGVVYVD